MSGVYKPPVLVQANDYDPWGLDISNFQQNNHDNFKYSGKEQYKELGLDWYDFGARMYDAPIGRWHAVDPLAGINERFSPFVANDNNPLSFVDPDGMDAQKAEDFSYSDGYSNLSARNSSGSINFSGAYHTPDDDKQKKASATNQTSENKNEVSKKQEPTNSQSLSFPILGPSIIALGLPIIHKKLVPKWLLRSFVTPGASEWTSISSVAFRKIIPQTWQRVSWLPKATSLGGQLGRVTSAVGVYTTTAQLIIEGYQSMTPEQKERLYQVGPGGYVPDFQFQAMKNLVKSQKKE